MSKLNPVALVFFILTLGLSAQAQKNEASFLVGGLKTGSRGVTDAAASSIDTGASVAYEVNVATRLVNAKLVSLYFEVPLIVAPNTDLNSSNVLVPNNYSSIFFTPGLKLKAWTMSPLSPYAVLGAGIGHFNSSSTLRTYSSVRTTFSFEKSSSCLVIVTSSKPTRAPVDRGGMRSPWTRQRLDVD